MGAASYSLAQRQTNGSYISPEPLVENDITYTAIQWSDSRVGRIAPSTSQDCENASIYKTEKHPTIR